MSQRSANPLAALFELGRQAREAASPAEQAFVLVNDSHALVPYRQAALWFAGRGVRCLSGVVQVEANAPYVQWLDGLCRELAAQGRPSACIGAGDFSGRLAEQWAEWLPEHGLWLALREPGSELASGGLLLARELPWADAEVALLAEWVATWHHLWLARQRRTARWWSPHPASRARRWWQRKRVWLPAAALALLLVPVRLTVLAPGELVPAHPAVIRAPLDGVIDAFHVQPNATVRAGQPLFGFDEALLRGRLEVARQSLATAEAEYRQTAQQALADSRSRAQLSALTGRIEEKRAEAELLAEQLTRARVLAPQDGIALFDDPSEWLGRPVTTGERVMRIATPGDVEVEAWVPVGDAIPLEHGAALSLHLNASPLAPVRAQLRYLAHDAVERPDGSYAYRLRAHLAEPSAHRVGLKGTARLSGRWVPLGYWMLRRPLAALRAYTGL